MAKPNPAYGSGIFRRRMSLRVAGHRVAVDMEDDNHGFRVRLEHDGDRVTGLEIDAVRHPFNTCPEAIRLLQQRLLGLRLDEEEKTLRTRLVPGENCTHMYDMALIAMAHARDAESCVIYDMEVEDECKGITTARVARDGQTIHTWKIGNHTLLAPAEHAGQPVMRGFYQWASRAFSGIPREAAMVLQRAYFVAQSRRYSYAPAADHPATSDGMPRGSCYSYNAGAVERAHRSDGTIRTFSDAPGKLLKFMP